MLLASRAVTTRLTVAPAATVVGLALTTKCVARPALKANFATKAFSTPLPPKLVWKAPVVVGKLVE